jgi:hypothetical protein
MKLPKISLDTNVFIFGLRKIDPFAGIVLKHLFQFDVSIPAQVDRELRINLTENELHQFYELIGLLSTFYIGYQPPADTLLNIYRQFGLKTGDAKIAAFCEQENIEIFVSENRHFLQKLPKRSFVVIDSKTFCQRFSFIKVNTRKI